MKFRNFTIYLLFASNCIYSLKHGFSWLFWVCAVLTAATLVLDVMEVIHNARK